MKIPAVRKSATSLIIQSQLHATMKLKMFYTQKTFQVVTIKRKLVYKGGVHQNEGETPANDDVTRV